METAMETMSNENSIYLELPRAAHETAWAVISRLIESCGGEASPDLRLAFGEALANVGKHSADGLAVIEIVPNCTRISVAVVDFGPGFNVAGVPTPDVEQIGGRGVFLIKQLGGTVESVLGRGTRVSLSTPIVSQP
jgi:anti-sigma regulatory factor (Ser/Thr protein kinase)